MKTLLKSLLSLFYPDLCVICRRRLVEGEKHLCLHCLVLVPKTNYHLQGLTAVEDRFKGKILYEKISGYIFYNKGGIGTKIVSEIKYRGNQNFGSWFSYEMASELQSSGFFDGIDVIIPVPLHKKKKKKRGFNQAELIATSIAVKTGIPIDTACLYRCLANPTQTRKSSFDRWLNTRYVFAVRQSGIYDGKHVLLIDDVLTTGSTLEACATIILNCNEAKISILTMAITQ